jgi:hypothetical protein
MALPLIAPSQGARAFISESPYTSAGASFQPSRLRDANLAEARRSAAAAKRERRHDRSEARTEALNLQLAAAVSAFFPEGRCVLADADGNLLGSSTRLSQDPADLLLANLGPLQDEERFGAQVSKRAEEIALQLLGIPMGMARMERVVVWRFYAGGRQVYLIAVGHPTFERDLGICRAVLGARRILGHSEAASMAA